MPAEIEIAWAAGLFEGEGCFDASGGKHCFRPRATMSTTDKDVMDKFKGIVGVGTIRLVYPYKSHHKIHWHWYTTEAEFHIIANMFKPFLCSRRKQAIEIAIKNKENYVKLKTAPVPCKVCGTLFNRLFKKGKPILFCSEICRKKRNP